MVRGSRFALAALVILFFAVAYYAHAQVTAASLTGEITDSTGAAVPGAAITLKNTDTNLTETTISNDQGVYKVSPLPPGTYVLLTVKAQSFSTYVQQGHRTYDFSQCGSECHVEAWNRRADHSGDGKR